MPGAWETLFLPGLFHAVHRVTGITFKQYLETLYRPFLASLVMAATVIMLNVLVPLPGSYRLAADIILGAAFFLASGWVLWNDA